MLSYKTLLDIDKYIQAHYDPSIPADMETEAGAVDELSRNRWDPSVVARDGFLSRDRNSAEAARLQSLSAEFDGITENRTAAQTADETTGETAGETAGEAAETCSAAEISGETTAAGLAAGPSNEPTADEYADRSANEPTADEYADRSSNEPTAAESVNGAEQTEPCDEPTEKEFPDEPAEAESSDASDEESSGNGTVFDEEFSGNDTVIDEESFGNDTVFDEESSGNDTVIEEMPAEEVILEPASAHGSLFTKRRSLFGKLLSLIDGSGKLAEERAARYRDIPDEEELQNSAEYCEDVSEESALLSDAECCENVSEEAQAENPASLLRGDTLPYGSMHSCTAAGDNEAENTESDRSADETPVFAAVTQGQTDQCVKMHPDGQTDRFARQPILAESYLAEEADKPARQSASDAGASGPAVSDSAASGPAAPKVSGFCSKAINLDLERRFRLADKGFADLLLCKIDAAGMSDVQCYTRAQLNRSHFNRIKNDPEYHVTKRTVEALILALRLDRVQADELLTAAGYALSNGSKTDIIVQYCIEYKIFDVMEVNELLYAYDQPLLGAGIRN